MGRGAVRLRCSNRTYYNMNAHKIHVPRMRCSECGETEEIFQEGIEIYCSKCGLVLHDLSICRPTLADMEAQDQLQHEEEKQYFQKLLKTLHGNH